MTLQAKSLPSRPRIPAELHREGAKRFGRKLKIFPRGQRRRSPKMFRNYWNYLKFTVSCVLWFIPRWLLYWTCVFAVVAESLVVTKLFLAVGPDVTQFLHWSIMNHHEPSMMNQSWGSHFWCHIPRFLVQAPRCQVRATRWNWCEARTSWEPMQNDPLKCLFSKVSEQGE